MTKIENLINCIDSLDPTRENLDKKTLNMYNKIISDSRDLSDALDATGIAPFRERILNIMYLIEDIFMGKKEEQYQKVKNLILQQAEIHHH